MTIPRSRRQRGTLSITMAALNAYQLCFAFHSTYRIGSGINIKSSQRASNLRNAPSESVDDVRLTRDVESYCANDAAPSSVLCIPAPLPITNNTLELDLLTTTNLDSAGDKNSFLTHASYENKAVSEMGLASSPCTFFESEKEIKGDCLIDEFLASSNKKPEDTVVPSLVIGKEGAGDFFIDEYLTFSNTEKPAETILPSLAMEKENAEDVLFDEYLTSSNTEKATGIAPPSLTLEDDATMIGDATARSLSSPGLRKIFKLAIPAIGVWLCGPILSLIDTSSVGLLAGTVHQAALSPAVAVTEYSALLMAFLYTGTTNLVAASQEYDGADKTKPRTARTLIASLQLSFWVGASFGAVLLVASRPLLKLLIGNEALDPMVFETALKYVRIRALGMPAGTVIGSAQAACMGMQDVTSPLYVLAAAAIVNLLGDILLVGNRHPWFGGAAGAAWATVFSQFAALSFFMKWLLSRPTRMTQDKSEPIQAANNILRVSLFKSDALKSFTGSIKGRVSKPAMRTVTGATLSASEAATVFPNETVLDGMKNIKERAKLPSTIAVKKRSLRSLMKPLQNVSKKVVRNKRKTKSNKGGESFSTRGFLHKRFSPQHLARLPKKDVAKEFVPYVIPITTTSLGRVSSYVAMSHVISSALDTGAMAAQQVIISVFYCLTPIADSLNLTAQSLLPAIFQRPKGRDRANVLKETMRQMMQAGAMFGGVLLSLVCMIPLVCSWFTSDASVVWKINAVIPFLALSFLVHGLICAMEGCMLGQKDLGFLGKSYAAYFVGVPFFMLRAKAAALSGDLSIGLNSVWKIFMYYQLVRVCMFVGRVWKLGRKATAEASVQLMSATIEGGESL